MFIPRARPGLAHTARQFRHALHCRSFADQAGSSESARIALVQGASRGLGLEFVKQLLDMPDQRYLPHAHKMTIWSHSSDSDMLSVLGVHSHIYRTPCRVVATCRNPDKAAELHRLQDCSNGRLDLVQLDCTSEESIAKAASQVSGTHRHLDLLLNVAGILHIPGKMSPG